MRNNLIFSLWTALTVTGLFLGSASAQLSLPKGALTQQQKGAFNELSGEMVECSGYYMIASDCIQHSTNPRTPEVARSYKKAAKQLSTMGIAFGFTIGRSKEALVALFKLSVTRQMEAIKNNCMNVAVLLERYNNFCKQLAEHPAMRAKELMDGKFCNGSYHC